jgi:hypothetical protein
MSMITVTATGASVTSGESSAAVAIPQDSAGKVARSVRVSATAAAHVKLGTAGVTAAAGDLMVAPGDAVKLAVAVGLTHIAVIQDTTAGTVNIAPLEGF